IEIDQRERRIAGGPCHLPARIGTPCDQRVGIGCPHFPQQAIPIGGKRDRSRRARELFGKLRRRGDNVPAPVDRAVAVDCMLRNFRERLLHARVDYKSASRPLRSASRDASSYGSWFSSTALITLKMAVFVPMPRTSVSIATVVNVGWRTRERRA